MKFLLATVGLVMALAAATGWVSFKLARESDVQEALHTRGALTWLRTDFHLNDAQFAAIRSLHESYSVVCEGHCRAIQEAIAARDAIKASSQVTDADRAAAQSRVEALREVCETAIAQHVRQVAAEMAPEEGRRYLALVLPRIADLDHRAAPDLGLNTPHH